MKLTIDQVLQKGIEAHNAGKLKDADRYYTTILEAHPMHPDANHNMGVLAVNVGKIDKALRFFKTALERNPKIVRYWLSYIDALIKLNRMTDAKTLFEEAKNHVPTGPEFYQIERRLEAFRYKHLNAQEPSQKQLQAISTLYSQDKFELALSDASQLLEEFSASANLYNIIGALNQRLGKSDDAIKAYKSALSIEPNYAEAHNNMGSAFKGQGKLEAAINAYKNALSIKPNYAEASYNLGNALKEKGKLGGAIKAYKNALSIKPDYAEAYNNMGSAFKGQGKLDEAINAYKNALSIKPKYAEAYNNMGISLKGQGKLEDAINAYKNALSIKPNYAEAYNNMGSALNGQGKLEDAINAYKNALSIKPDYAEALFNLSGTAKNLAEAKEWIGKCLTVNPNYLEAKLMRSALEFYEDNRSEFNLLLKSPFKDHPYMRSFIWTFGLPKLPSLYFNRWSFFDGIIAMSTKERPFYEFGVWRGDSFKYLIKRLKKGYGFDSFEGLPEDWHNKKAGTYSSDSKVPTIARGTFIVGKFENSLQKFFANKRPKACIINFDADLYSSTIYALNHAKSVIDKHTILIFDEFIINKNWEQDEFKALEEFCNTNHYNYEVIAISFFTKQVAVKIIGI